MIKVNQTEKNLLQQKIENKLCEIVPELKNSIEIVYSILSIFDECYEPIRNSAKIELMNDLFGSMTSNESNKIKQLFGRIESKLNMKNKEITL